MNRSINKKETSYLDLQKKTTKMYRHRRLDGNRSDDDSDHRYGRSSDDDSEDDRIVVEWVGLNKYDLDLNEHDNKDRWDCEDGYCEYRRSEDHDEDHGNEYSGHGDYNEGHGEDSENSGHGEDTDEDTHHSSDHEESHGRSKEHCSKEHCSKEHCSKERRSKGRRSKERRSKERRSKERHSEESHPRRRRSQKKHDDGSERKDRHRRTRRCKKPEKGCIKVIKVLGPTGPEGPQGFDGPTGPPNECIQTDYFYACGSAEISRTILVVPFDTIKVINGFDHPNNTDFVIPTTGTYRLSWSFSTDSLSPSTLVDLAVRKNGDLIDDQSYTSTSGGVESDFVSHTFLADLMVGDVLQLEMVTSIDAPGPLIEYTFSANRLSCASSPTGPTGSQGPTGPAPSPPERCLTLEELIRAYKANALNIFGVLNTIPPLPVCIEIDTFCEFIRQECSQPGPTGPTGPQGDDGPTGPTGPTGPSFVP